jgi:beta propeller repeat protein
MKAKSFLAMAAIALSSVIFSFVPTSLGLQVTQNNYEDSFPHMKNNYLVWQGKANGTWEIFLYNTDTQAYRQLTNNEYNDIAPQTDGTYVVWVGYNTLGGEIFLYNISTQETTQITTDSAVHNPPKIADGRVVWASHGVTDSVEPGEIFLYDVRNGSPTCLSQAVDPGGMLDDSSPRINTQRIMWVQSSDVATKRFVYNVATGTIAEVPAGFVWEDNPQTNGPLQVFTAHDGNDREVFVRNTSLKTVKQLSENGFEDVNPCISGSHVAWVGGLGEASEVFLATLTGKYAICYCEMVPEANEVPRGGTLGFDVSVTNMTEKRGYVRFGTKVTKPNGVQSDYVWGPFQVGLDSYQSKSGHKTHTIHANFPLGISTYHGYVDLTGTGIIAECKFGFKVVPPQ